MAAGSSHRQRRLRVRYTPLLTNSWQPGLGRCASAPDLQHSSAHSPLLALNLVQPDRLAVPPAHMHQISMSQISPVITKETTMWRCWVGFGGLQCQPQHGTYFVQFSFRFSRIGSRLTPLSVTVSAHCRAGNAWWFCCALQALVFRLVSRICGLGFGESS
jgi:hypothetical protein